MMQNIPLLYKILIGFGVLFLIVYVTPLRYWDPIWEGQEGISDSIKESKERGVFIKEYKPKSTPIIINDTLRIEIREAWLEYGFWYTIFKNQNIINKNTAQMRVTVNPKGMKYYNKTWRIYKGFNIKSDAFVSDFGYYKGRLTSSYLDVLNSYPEIRIPIRRLDHLKESPVKFPMDTLGWFELSPVENGM